MKLETFKMQNNSKRKKINFEKIHRQKYCKNILKTDHRSPNITENIVKIIFKEIIKV